MAGQADSLKSILYALFANTAIAIAKGVAAFITGPDAMVAVKARMTPAGSEKPMVKAINTIGGTFAAISRVSPGCFLNPTWRIEA